MVYSIVWAVLVFAPLNKRVYWCVLSKLSAILILMFTQFSRFPGSLPYVILDVVEKAYLAGFGVLQLFVTLFPLLTSRSGPSQPADHAQCTEEGDHSCSTVSEKTSGMEFLPLMLTSVYCAIGLVWAFVRLSFLYLRQRNVGAAQ